MFINTEGTPDEILVKLRENASKIEPLIVECMGDEIYAYSQIYAKMHNITEDKEKKEIAALLASYTIQLVLSDRIILKRRLEDGKKE